LGVTAFLFVCAIPFCSTLINFMPAYNSVYILKNFLFRLFCIFLSMMLKFFLFDDKGCALIPKWISIK
jgi:hypothetical protein